jgi:hypothetical protein
MIPVRMKLEIREFLKHATISRPYVEQLGAILPEDDLELDALIGEIVRESDQQQFMTLVMAALVHERSVDARHLAGGTRLIGVPAYVLPIALRMKGDVAEYMLEGTRNTAMYNLQHSMALLSILVWCDDNRSGVYPEGLIPEARAFARRNSTSPDANESEAYVLEIARRTNDTALAGIIRQRHPKMTDAQWKTVLEAAYKVAEVRIEQSRRPLLDLIPEAPLEPLNVMGTVRRSVPKIGRNDPCHCGSGKKYKNCHYAEDQRRLQQSSDVAGVTQKELRESIERHMTLERLEKLSVAELGRLNPMELPRPLLTEYFVRLSISDLDRAAQNLEKLGFTEDLEDSWFFTMWTTVRAGRKDIADRLMRMRPDQKEEELRLSMRALLAQDDPAKVVRMLEDAALKALKTEDADDLTDVAYSAAFSKFPALGILLYRGVLPFVAPEKAKIQYEQVLAIRDRLNLPPDDPVNNILEARLLEAGEDASAKLLEAEAKWETKRREARELKEQLDQVQKDLARFERSVRESATAAAGSSENDEVVRTLRQKVRNLQADLKEKHEETNALQQQLEEEQAKVDALRESAQRATPAAAAESEPDHEDDLLMPQGTEETHPLRLIEFPGDFQRRLKDFPHHVARAAMIMLGRLAGGDSAAFSGAKRLKSRPNVVRQRIGIDFRLLFRLLPDRIQVIDLIPRQDFERRIKSLP